MMRALAWKEVREHRMVWLTMLSLALLSVLGLPITLKTEGMDTLQVPELRIVIAAAVIIAGVYGLVCGAMMLASEREQGTLPFLDSLTGRRGGVWFRKLLLGIVFALVLGLIVGAAAMAMGLEGYGWPRRLWLIALPAVAVQAFLWGMVGSALCRSVMPAIGVGAVLSVLVCFFSAPLVLAPGGRVIGVTLQVIFAIAAIAFSATAFCRSDLTRYRTTATARPLFRFLPSGHGWFSLVWLLYRQAFWEVVVLGVLAFVVGLFMAADVMGVWALGTLLLGLLCGTGVFAGEQRGGYARYLGDQRLPVGRIWLAKLVAYAGVAVLLSAVLVMGGLLSLTRHGWMESPDSRSETLTGFMVRVIGLWPAVVLWLGYGFAFGQFFSMVFRKGVVAVVLAGVTAICMVGLWLPSLLLGGVHGWQVFGLPLVLIVASRLVAWAWMTDGLPTWRPAIVLTICIAIGLIWTGGGIAYRVVEVPDGGPPFDVATHEVSLPTPEKNRAGELIARACRTILQVEKEADEAFGSPSPWPPEGMKIPEGTRPGFAAIARFVPDQGMPQSLPTFDRWLDKVFESESMHLLTEAAALPLGVVLSPRQMELGRSQAIIDLWNGLRELHPLLNARAIQLQARDNDAAALDHVVLMLALSRHLRHHAIFQIWLHGVSLEREALEALERLVSSPRVSPALLRRALLELQQHEQQTPSPVECLQAEYLVARARLRQPLPAFERQLAGERRTGDGMSGHLQLLAACYSVPWEHERARRLLDEVFAGRIRGLERGYPAADWLEVASFPYAWGLLRGWIPAEGDDRKLEAARLWPLLKASWLIVFHEHPIATPLYPATLSRCRVAAAELQLALVLYQLETGKPAERLDLLVPNYLATMPLDPFSGRPFSYRISDGGKLNWRPSTPHDDETSERIVPAGQGILWSTGPDGIDHGGMIQGIDFTEQQFGQVVGPHLDVIFIVPNPKRPRSSPAIPPPGT
jgi:hypothetical protein